VAVSRARDQLWLITSLGMEDLGPEDLRYRMLSHYSVAEQQRGDVVEPDRIPMTALCEPFVSLFAQQVYRAIRLRGYDADAMVAVGGRRLDIVVRGRDSSVAVMCDEYTGLTRERREADDDALRELQRAGWPFCRVAHSRFVLDPDEALAPVWRTLADHGVDPVEA
jgi:hypothetical protein